MADVLIVCVREDEPQAKALADMFEAAGFSIGGAPNSDAALRSSGASVVVWSQASIRSRPFLDAAQRVINAEKAVVASLIEPPPPSSVGASPTFDLSSWDGDPNDPALDPLFFAVDRMVNTARVGAAQQRSAPAYDAPPPTRSAPALRVDDPPPPRRQEPAYRAPPPAPAPSYRVPPASDALGSEAEHWRAIRDSRNPTDFMDYLARYGPDGAFSEVAELRLKQLTGPNDNRAPQRPVARPSAPVRAEPAPRRPEALPPTQRRAEPPAPARRPPIERDYTEDLLDPPRGQGGPLRAFVLIALLGGVALAGGLYFGGGLGDPSTAPEAATVAPESSTTPTDFSGLEEAPSTPLSEASAVQPDRQTEAQAQRERERRERQREEERERQAAARDAERASQAATQQVSSPAPSNATIDPLSPSASTAPPQTASPPPLQTANVEPTIRGPTANPRPPAAGTVSWAQRPSARRIAELYPDRALRDGVGGRVVLDCRVLGNLAVACSVASETPAGEGFGRAAVTASSNYRASPTLSNGASAVGASTRIAVNFQAPQ